MANDVTLCSSSSLSGRPINSGAPSEYGNLPGVSQCGAAGRWMNELFASWEVMVISLEIWSSFVLLRVYSIAVVFNIHSQDDSFLMQLIKFQQTRNNFQGRKLKSLLKIFFCLHVCNPVFSLWNPPFLIMKRRRKLAEPNRFLSFSAPTRDKHLFLPDKRGCGGQKVLILRAHVSMRQHQCLLVGIAALPQVG